MLLTDKLYRGLIYKNLFLVLATVIVLAACTNTPPPQVLSLNSVQFVDPYLQGHIQIDGKTLSLSDTGNKRLNVMLRNTSKQPVSIEVNTAWYNADFISTEETKSWQRVELKQNQTHILQTYATNENSSHFVVNVRHGGT